MKDKLVVAAAGTGEGKTLVGLALAALLARRGIPVQPFKIGPDYIDARLYENVCGRAARNVDLWLDGAERVRSHVGATAGSVALLEGMMGLFDGDTMGDTSTAHVAALLDAPVLLVIDLWRMSQSAAAIALGCSQMLPRVHIAGVILNRVGGAAHESAVRRAFTAIGVPVVAVLPNRIEWKIPERHLGLDLERVQGVATIAEDVADVLADQIDPVFFPQPREQVPGPGERLTTRRGPSPRIAVADDSALWFTYPETIEALEHAGAQIARFSVLRDSNLPAGAHGLWLGGGYPESHVGELAANEAMRRSIASAIDAGLPVYAECGGMMYLAGELETHDGVFPMCGALRGRTSIAQPRLHIGYRRAQALHDSVCDERGDDLKAYEFHYASESLSEEAAYSLEDSRTGAWRPHVLASFLHRHFLAGDAAVERFVAQCA
ncbi:MAG TPA: cobyrinate a,c-diamide synthase [Candidatus Rubrimentiphilum sp.]|nr:cobyrinate a,c-diamide synthase [Candidatus Rubrimentiphilum sp.]